MSLTLYLHPLSSYCHKVLIALYETGVPFTPHMVNLGDPESRAAFAKVWSMAKFPVIRDEVRNETVPESTIIIEYLAQYYPGKTQLLGSDAETARNVRFWDRFYDLYVHENMGRIVADRLRPADKKDAFGVEQYRAKLKHGLDMVDAEMKDKTWAIGEHFTMADCAAAPALFYADKVLPFADTHKNAAAYLARLKQRPSYARTLKEAEPFFHMFPTA